MFPVNISRAIWPLMRKGGFCFPPLFLGSHRQLWWRSFLVFFPRFFVSLLLSSLYCKLWLFIPGWIRLSEAGGKNEDSFKLITRTDISPFGFYAFFIDKPPTMKAEGEYWCWTASASGLCVHGQVILILHASVSSFINLS